MTVTRPGFPKPRPRAGFFVCRVERHRGKPVKQGTRPRTPPVQHATQAPQDRLHARTRATLASPDPIPLPNLTPVREAAARPVEAPKGEGMLRHRPRARGGRYGPSVRSMLTSWQQGPCCRYQQNGSPRHLTAWTMRLREFQGGYPPRRLQFARRSALAGPGMGRTGLREARAQRVQTSARRGLPCALLGSCWVQNPRKAKARSLSWPKPLIFGSLAWTRTTDLMINSHSQGPWD